MRKILIVGLLLYGSLAHGKLVEGVVVRVADGEVVVDLGAARGLPPNASLKVFRRLVVKHPVTEKAIEDRFPIGQVKTAAVGELLSIVTDLSGLARPPQVGDYVVFGPTAPAAPPATVTTPTPHQGQDGQTAALQATVADNLGRPIGERIINFEAVLRVFPEGPYTDSIGAELRTLRAVHSELRTPTVASPASPVGPDSFTVRHMNPKWTQRGEPLELTVAIVEHEWVVSTRLLLRRRGDPRWETLEMTRDGDFHFRVKLSEDWLATVSDLEYVIEAVRDDGVLDALVGSTRKPERITIAPPPPPEEAPGRTKLTTMARYVDFNTGGEATDAYFQFEAGIDYGVNWRSLTAVRFGLGVIDGEGGPTEAIDQGASTRTLNVNYAFAEAEMTPSSIQWLGFSLRVMGGNHHSTDNNTSTAVTGAEGRIRVGNADETRLVVGASAFQDLGNQAFTDLHIEVFDRVPLMAGVAVTNLPVDEDQGVRLYARAGYEALDWLTLVLESGWNARTINHNGFTGGGGLVLDW